LFKKKNVPKQHLINNDNDNDNDLYVRLIIYFYKCMSSLFDNVLMIKYTHWYDIYMVVYIIMFL